ncbi:unnamed protein product [Sphagnum jensenii]|uniref:Ribosomal protein S5 n=1 Tax=Sphagnum jensenii TaxID=128206 RepID=A0ABP0WX99_9BRYO
MVVFFVMRRGYLTSRSTVRVGPTGTKPSPELQKKPLLRFSGRYGSIHASSDHLLLKAVVFMAIVSNLVRIAHYLILEVFPHLEYLKWKSTPSSAEHGVFVSVVVMPNFVALTAGSRNWVYVKSHMTKAYFKRFQIKFMCRQGQFFVFPCVHISGKTDYWARIRLTTQDKNKCNTPKYCYVVRFTNKDIVPQITYVTLAGDIVLTAAYAHELPHYGLKGGLTNYAAAYSTGLLLAQRHLKKFELDEDSTQAMKRFATGEDFNVEGEDKRPFRALLDVGLVRSTTGNRVFGPLKGSFDGGLDIPHSQKWFAGFSKED